MSSPTAVTNNGVPPASSPPPAAGAVSVPLPGPLGGAGTAPPTLLRSGSMSAPGLVRTTSVRPASAEWRSFVTIEERTAIRVKLSDAYRKHCPSYEELLEAVAAIDEELLFSSAQHRMDYFKTAIDFDNRVQIKRKQLSGILGVAGMVDRPVARRGPSILRTGGDDPLPTDDHTAAAAQSIISLSSMSPTSASPTPVHPAQSGLPAHPPPFGRAASGKRTATGAGATEPAAAAESDLKKTKLHRGASSSHQ